MYNNKNIFFSINLIQLINICFGVKLFLYIIIHYNFNNNNNNNNKDQKKKMIIFYLEILKVYYIKKYKIKKKIKYK